MRTTQKSAPDGALFFRQNVVVEINRNRIAFGEAVGRFAAFTVQLYMLRADGAVEHRLRHKRKRFAYKLVETLPRVVFADNELLHVSSAYESILYGQI